MDWFTSLRLEWPLLLGLLALPWLVRKGPEAPVCALRWPGKLDDLGTPTPLAGRAVARGADGDRTWRVCCWILLVVAVARPQWIDVRDADDLQRRDVLLTLDTSASMSQRDVVLGGAPRSRLEAARYLVDALRRERPNYRLGLAVFGGQVWLHTPLTWDHQAVMEAARSLDVGLAGEQTALGDAVAYALTYLGKDATIAPAVVLISDGKSTAGALSVGQAAWLAQRSGIPVHVMQVGPENGVSQPLRELAAASGGEYAHVGGGAGVSTLLAKIEETPPQQAATRRAAKVHELYPWPLAVALALALWRAWRRSRRDTEWVSGRAG